jgi:ABC-type branched-subunit amino acid transport system permease subunit
MRRKAIFFIAGIFLVIAVIVPASVLILLFENNSIIVRNPNGLQTNGNISVTPNPPENRTTIYTILAIIIAVFLSLFAITLYLGIKESPKTLVEE